MQIETERLILRRLTAADVEPLARILSDPVTMQHWPAPLTAAEVEAWVARNLRRYADDGFGRMALLLAESREVIGDCGIVRAEVAGEPVYDLGYIVHHPHWGRGYATEAALALRDHAFRRLALPALHANMAFDNRPSRRVAERIGMRLVREYENPRNRNLRTFLYRIDAP